MSEEVKVEKEYESRKQAKGLIRRELRLKIERAEERIMLAQHDIKLWKNELKRVDEQ